MAKKRRPSKNINAKGRSKYDDSQYLKLPHKLIKSPQFRYLGGNEKGILLEICSRHNGYNNGCIGAGLQDLSDTLRISKSTANRGVKKLQKMKFIVKHKQGQFMGRIASEWEVTFLPREGNPPTNEWGQAKVPKMKRKPKNKTLEEELLEDIKMMEIEEI